MAVKKKRFEFFDHTADAKFRAYGKNIEEAFSNAALALSSIMTEPEKIKPKKSIRITKKSKGEHALLYDFLEQLVFLADTEGFIIGGVEKIKIKKNGNFFSLDAVVKGDDAENYDIGTQIKAITYNEMSIKKLKSGVVVQVVPDL